MKSKKIWIDSTPSAHGPAFITESEPMEFDNTCQWWRGGYVYSIPRRIAEIMIGEHLPPNPLLSEVVDGKIIRYWLPADAAPPEGWEFA